MDDEDFELGKWSVSPGIKEKMKYKKTDKYLSIMLKEIEM